MGSGRGSQVLMALKGILGQGMLSPICLVQVHGTANSQLPCDAQTASVACLTTCSSDACMHVHMCMNVQFLFTVNILNETQDYTYLTLHVLIE